MVEHQKYDTNIRLHSSTSTYRYRVSHTKPAKTGVKFCDHTDDRLDPMCLTPRSGLGERVKWPLKQREGEPHHTDLGCFHMLLILLFLHSVMSVYSLSPARIAARGVGVSVVGCAQPTGDTVCLYVCFLIFHRTAVSSYADSFV